MMSGAPPTAESNRGRVGRRFVLLTIWLVVSGLIGMAGGYGADWYFASGYAARVGLGLGAIIFVHIIFVTSLFDAHLTSTSKSKLIRNLAWSLLYIVAIVAIYALLFSMLELKRDGVILSGDLGAALFFSVVTWTTLGYGDITPAEPFAQLLAGGAALNGYLVMAVFIAVLVQTFQRLATERSS